MNTESPRVSIGMPVYNGEHYVEGAISSILAQTYQDFTFIISDNGSTDRTRAICESYAAQDSRIQYHRYEQNRGASWNFNNAFKLSTTKYFKWACHDDLIAPTMVEQCVEVLERELEVILAYPQARIIDEHGETIGIWSDNLELRSPYPHKRLHQYLRNKSRNEALYGVMRARALEKTGLLRPVAYCDQMLMAELAMIGQFRELPEPTFMKRFHAGISTEVYSQQAYRAFFDPKLKGKASLPRVERLLEFVRRINHVPMLRSERLKCYAELRVLVGNPSNLSHMIEDLRVAGATLIRRNVE